MRIHTPAHSFDLAGQRAWFHDESFDYGPVHTYDALRLPGPDPRPRKMHVLVPWGYDGDSARYPVIYMNDGQTALFPGGVGPHSWRVAETLGDLTARGLVEPVIVIALHPIHRDAEYTHGPWFPGRDYGGLDAYARYVTQSVKPWVDSAYLTKPEPQHTAIVGSSHGGLAAFYIGNRYPRQFGWIGALSPSFWVGRPRFGSDAPLEDSDLIALTRGAMEDRALRPRIWLDWGLAGDGTRRSAAEMADLLPRVFGYESGRDLWVHVDEHGGHDEQAWAYRFGLLLQTFFPRR